MDRTDEQGIDPESDGEVEIVNDGEEIIQDDEIPESEEVVTDEEEVMKNQYGSTVHNEVNDTCSNCGKQRGRHTTLEAINCQRAIGNSV